jgi:hypothetical protein
VPNLDAYTSWGSHEEEARATKGSIVKSSLGNVMRLLRPMVVIDEGHHAYTETALKTIDGFNPCFMLELSATPRVSSDKGSGSNILVNVRGTDLDEAEMIKLPIHVDMRGWADWQSCLAEQPGASSTACSARRRLAGRDQPLHPPHHAGAGGAHRQRHARRGLYPCRRMRARFWRNWV